MLDAGVAPIAASVEPVAAAVQAVAPRVAQAAGQVSFVWWLPVIVALTLLLLIELFRSLPWSEKAKAGKPVGCDVCLVGWGSIALGALFAWQLGAAMMLFHVPAAGGLTLMLLALRRYWAGPVELRPPG